MGTRVEFPSNGSVGSGYLAVPESGSGPGVVVFQEWWGLNDQIMEVCDRYASEGFVALAPDLFRGEVASEPDEAGKLMMALNLEQAARDMSGAVDFLADHEATTGSGLGVTGYCMGGGLALLLATRRSDHVKACAPYYGVIPWPGLQPDYSDLSGPVQGHYAENDDFANAEAVAALEDAILAAGQAVEIFVYPGTEHAFTNHQRPDVYKADETEQAFARTFAFFGEQLT